MTKLATALLEWYDHHGRRALPWQRDRDPYRIWVSEIMLQQTQVTTVIPYYEGFMARFPDLATLAAAPLDDVLHHWTGLGYYARARNLHRAAALVRDRHAGTMPADIDALCALPGIGRSTAGAILAFAHGQRHPILDGNVKRVLTRVHRIADWPGRSAVAAHLWELANEHTPGPRVADYTQAIMDLGATVCLRRNPRCSVCPLESLCAAARHGDPQNYPGRAPKRARPVRQVRMIMIRNDTRQVLLERRPPAGVWGGLWGFPECAAEDDAAEQVAERYGLDIELLPGWPGLRHSFTHFHLDIVPVPARLVGDAGGAMENAETVWYNPLRPDARGLAAPVKRLLDKLR